MVDIKKCLQYLKCFFFCYFLFSVSILAQVSTANVSGMVEDSAQARIPKTDVKLINVLTGTENASTTDNDGIFFLPGVLPGAYVLQIERDGFATARFTGINLNIGDTKSFLIRLKIGTVDQTVTVDAAGMILDTTDASISTVVDQKFVENIPLSGRSFKDLIAMTPGVITQTPQAAGPGDFSVNGQRPESNSVTVDGVSGNIGSSSLVGNRKVASTGSFPAATALGTTQSLVPVDALQEFRILGSTYSAEYGRTPGGQFSLLTRSGTNALHGSFYDYIRNGKFDANGFFFRFNDAWNATAFHQQNFGGTFGAPVVLSHIYDGHDRSFLFFSYEGLKVIQPTAPLAQFVPEVTLHQEVPDSLRPVLKAFPVGFGTGSEIPGFPVNSGLAGYFDSDYYTPPGHITATTIRLDHAFSSKLSTFLRVSNTPSYSQARNLSSLTSTHINTQTFTFGATVQLSTTKKDDLRFGYARSNSLLNTGLSEVSDAIATNLGADLGLPGSFPSARAEAFIHIAGIGDSAINTDQATNYLHQWNFRNTLDFQVAHHLLRIGVDQRRIVSAIRPPAASVEADFFNLDSMLKNLASSFVMTKNQPATPVFNEFAAFVQDEWHIADTLNLSLGMRWEVNPAPGEEHGKNAYTLVGNVNAPATLQLAPRGTPLWQTDWYSFAPRLGVAWAANNTRGKELIVRAGTGVFFDTGNQAAVNAFNAIGFSATVHRENVSIPVDSSAFDFSTTPSAPFLNTTAFAFPSHLQLPYVLQWNIAMEKALGKNQTFTASYVGADGKRLLQPQRRNIRLINPDFGEVNFFPSGITSSYQALQLKFQRSISPGLQVLASYGWSHTFDYGSTDAAFPLTYADSDFDVRQNLQAAFSWNEPELAGTLMQRNLLSGWGIDGRLIVRSAFPVTPLGNLLSDFATGDRYYSGVDLIPGVPLYLYGKQYPGGRIFNGGPQATNPAFRLPDAAAPGNAPRNFLRGFGDQQLNFAIRKEIPLYDRLNLQLRVETFNTLNHLDLGYIDRSLTDILFGQPTLLLNQSFGSNGSLYQQGGPLAIQFGVKVTF